MERFLDYIGKNYDKLKTQLQKYKNFDEDIFHNTIIKCSEVVQDIHLKFKSDNDVIRYFIGAYKTNLLRQKMYYYEKNVDHPDQITDNTVYASNTVYGIDANIIIKDITDSFGEDLKDIYIEYITEGLAIAELQKKYNVKNLKQKLKNIKEYINKKYTDHTSDTGY